MLGTLPEIEMNACEDEGKFARQQVKTVTHAVELLSFVQNRNRRHLSPGFLESL